LILPGLIEFIPNIVILILLVCFQQHQVSKHPLVYLFLKNQTYLQPGQDCMWPIDILFVCVNGRDCEVHHRLPVAGIYAKELFDIFMNTA
jgi:hypothetical protein